jgi:Holliday junction resolvase RusA-like endonuclease
MDDTWKWFVLDVNPEPWRIGPVSVGRRGGKVFGTVGRDQQLHYYKEAVRSELDAGDFEPIVGKVELMFFFWRRRDEYKTPQARTHRKHEADVTNLQKATEDALQGILFKNDKDTNDIRGVMVEQGADVTPRIAIAIRRGHEVPMDALRLIPDNVWSLLNELDKDDLAEENRL